MSEMDLLDIVTTDLDLLTPMDSLSNCELEDISEMELTTPTLRDFLSLRYQLEEITASLLEKALRGISMEFYSVYSTIEERYYRGEDWGMLGIICYSEKA